MNWKELLQEEKNKEYYQNLMKFVEKEYVEKTCLPKKENIFNAFELTPLENVKVVILGQDPYPTDGVAMGLAFSVSKETKIPKSLHNMFLEAKEDINLEYPKYGDLSKWAENGVLLLNRILTVEKSKPLSHKNKGWEEFTLRVINEINNQDRKIVYILLGNEAKKIIKYITNPKHKIIEAPHPSPLSAYQGFFGSKIFSKTCDYLEVPYSFWSLV